jgi:hypothetical protein
MKIMKLEISINKLTRFGNVAMRIARANALRWKFDSVRILHLDVDSRLGVDWKLTFAR